ncbi:Zinc finger protein CONSTANS-like 9 [Vitis vinifera]|uniref:Zinc finger protein CONSTANS-like 9 n=1 Tax=Vitis vinifera TaxID=29760 RepID=A0A438EEI8_VITVI|nr:Zinc finger protein CONSTANS-like 9 [Vitis vinifera]
MNPTLRLCKGTLPKSYHLWTPTTSPYPPHPTSLFPHTIAPAVNANKEGKESHNALWVPCFATLFIYLIIIFNLFNRFDKRVRYASRKARADVRQRVKGRFVKAGEAYDYDPISETRSF